VPPREHEAAAPVPPHVPVRAGHALKKDRGAEGPAGADNVKRLNEEAPPLPPEAAPVSAPLPLTPATPADQGGQQQGLENRQPEEDAALAPRPDAPQPQPQPRQEPVAIRALTPEEIRGDNYHPSYPRRNPVPFYPESEAARGPAPALPVLMVAPPAAAVPAPVAAEPEQMSLPLAPVAVPEPPAPQTAPGAEDGMVRFIDDSTASAAPLPLAPPPPAVLSAPPRAFAIQPAAGAQESGYND
jgi:hypothetical protein